MSAGGPVAGRPGPDRALHGGDIAALGIFVALVGAVYFGLFNHDFSVNGLRYAEDVERGVEFFISWNHPCRPNFLYAVRTSLFSTPDWPGFGRSGSCRRSTSAPDRCCCGYRSRRLKVAAAMRC